MNFVPRSLLVSIAVSMMLHGALAALVSVSPAKPHLPRIEVHLSPMPAINADPLLKNNVAAATAVAAFHPPPPGGKGFSRISVQQVQDQKRKLAEHVFYPPQAIEQGLEGEVRLLLRLGEGGVLLEARVVSSSGYELLDQAAIAAAHAAGSFAGSRRELILPVVFRLSD